MSEKQAMRALQDEMRKSSQGEKIADRNITQITDFCRAYYIPLFAYVLYKDFGYRYVRLVRFGEQFNKIIALVAETNEADQLRARGVELPAAGGSYPHHYLSLSDIQSDLKVECGYLYRWQGVCEKPTGGSVNDYARYHARNHSARIMDNLKMMWLFTMWTTFAFGKKRLLLCEEYFRERIKGLPFSTFMNMLEEMELKCCTKTAGLSFDTNRRIFKRLGVDKEGATKLI